MGSTTFSGPVTSTNGFVGDVTGNVTGDVQGAALATAAGSGITDGTGTVIASEVSKQGKIINTQIFIDITGLGSSTDDLDIIGSGVSAAYLCKLDTSEVGQVFALTMTCLEAPTTGADDIDLYAADEATGVFDAGIGTLAETAVVTSGGAWTLNATATATGWPTDGQYLYLCGGEAGTADTYDAGQFLIEIWGYEA